MRCKSVNHHCKTSPIFAFSKFNLGISTCSKVLRQPDYSCKHCTGPIWYAESHSNIYFIMALLLVVPRVKTSMIINFLKSRITNVHLFEPHQHHHTTHRNPLLDLLNAVNLLVSSILPYHRCLWRCSPEFAEFSQFWIPEWPLSIWPHYSQRGCGDVVLDLFDALNLTITSILPSVCSCPLHKQKGRHFRNSEFPSAGIHHLSYGRTTVNESLEMSD